ncbi:MAG: polyprenyl synthetase family protein [Heliobacteriaceae bacterium]|nr:polyprenyl synthetase family protein [Heliobacteriaceae bacterium]MDD4587399.1 polyprenyl synthetase family protein [Heliobacteriaceae bacterium]
MSFNLFPEIQADLKQVETELEKHVYTDHPTLTAASGHLLHAGGKRLRPAFVLLAGKFYEYSLERLLPLAVALELLHMATLVHDDVIDESDTRRGIPTVRAQWGNRVSVHAGDHLFARSLLLVARLNNPVISRVMAKTCVEMCAGEIQQMVSAFDADQNFRDYLYRIKRKTALLIAASCQLGAIAAGAGAGIVRALKWYGYYLGMAFQITDDILDMEADMVELGKPVGSDLRQGIMTLPIIVALHRTADPSLSELVVKREKSEEEVREAIRLIRDTGSIEASHRVARLYLVKAKQELERLPAIPTRYNLALIAEFVGQRTY